MPTNNNSSKLAQMDGYSIYLFDDKQGHYFASIPDKDIDMYNLYVAFPRIELDYFLSDKTIGEIKENNEVVNVFDKNAVYIVPIINPKEFEEAGKNNDDESYDPFYVRLNLIMFDIYGRLNKKVNPEVKIVILRDCDVKFRQWLEYGNTRNPNVSGFFKGFNIEQFKRNYLENRIAPSSVGSDITDSGSGPVNVMGEISDGLSQSRPKKKTLAPPKVTHHGFSSFWFISLILFVSLVIGVTVSFVLIK